MNNIFQGLITALITPFQNDKIDFLGLEKILNYQINNNVDAVVVGGSTGEGTSLSNEEYKVLIKTAIDINKKRIPLIAGCAASNITAAMTTIAAVEELGVDGLMCTIPPYVKPTQEGIYKYFNAIHDYTKLPIMLYSIPSRTAVDFTDDTIIRLSELPRILALKDADRDLERPLRIGLKAQTGFNLLSGNDEVANAYNAHGGVGCVSVASNIAPELCKKLQDYCSKGDYAAALTVQYKLMPLYKALFHQPNPIPVKYAAEYLGLCFSQPRLPLLEANTETKTKIEQAIKIIGIAN